MIKNNKGTILVVAVTAMVIMIVIGYVCLQMYMNQGILDTYDVTKKRLFYSAQGAIEILKGDIIANSINGQDTGSSTSGYGYLYNNAKNYTGNSLWTPPRMNNLVGSHVFDGTMHPPIRVTVGIRRLTNARVNSDAQLKSLLHTATVDSDRHLDNDVQIRYQNFKTAIANNSVATPSPTYDKAYEIVATATTNHKTALSNNTQISCVIHHYIYTHFQSAKFIIVPVGWRIEN